MKKHKRILNALHTAIVFLIPSVVAHSNASSNMERRPAVVSPAPCTNSTTGSPDCDGTWGDGDCWTNGSPGSTIGSTEVVCINHDIVYNLSDDLVVDGEVNINNASLTTPIGSNRSIFIADNSIWTMCNSELILPIFDGNSNLSGNFINQGGDIVIFKSNVQIAQNWEDTGGGGVREMTESCLRLGENFINKDAADFYDGVCIELGLHGSGNFENEGTINIINGSSILFRGTSGNLVNVNSVTGGPSGIEALDVQDNVTNDGSWDVGIVEHCIGSSVSGNTSDFTEDLENPENCPAVDNLDCQGDCVGGSCTLSASCMQLDTVCSGDPMGGEIQVIATGATTACNGASGVTYTLTCLGCPGASCQIPNPIIIGPTNDASIVFEDLPPCDYSILIEDASGCTDTCSITVVEFDTPVVSCPVDITVDIGATAFTLTGGSPSGGTYSGPGVTAGQFDPLMAGQGVHVITYIYTDNNGCSGSCSFTVTVTSCVEPPDITCPTLNPVACSVALNLTTADYPNLVSSNGQSGACNFTKIAVASNVDVSQVSCDGTGNVVVTYTVTDNQGGSYPNLVCNQPVNAAPTPPFPQCPNYPAIECEEAFEALLSDYPDIVSSNGLTGTCNVTITATAVDIEIVGMVCDGSRAVIVTYTVTDNCGGTYQDLICTQLVNGPPLPSPLTCRNLQPIDCDVAQGRTATDYPFLISSNGFEGQCGLQYLGTPVSVDLSQIGCAGMVLITYAVTDNCGGTYQDLICTQPVNMSEVPTPPICPLFDTVACNLVQGLILSDYPDIISNNSATGACNIIITAVASDIDISGAVCDGTGVVVITYAVSDNCGGTYADLVCTQRVKGSECQDDLVLTLADSPLNGLYEARQTITINGNVFILDATDVILNAPEVLINELDVELGAELDVLQGGCD